MENKLKNRSEIDINLTWDLTRIYKTDEDMLKDLDKAISLSNDIVSNYENNLTNAKLINKCLDCFRQLVQKIYYCSTYSELAVSVDYYDAKNQELDNKVQSATSEILSKLSFIESEILLCTEDVIKEAMNKSEENRHYLQTLLRMKPHQLHPETEKALKALSQTFGAPYNIYNNTKLADMNFNNFTVNGKEYPLGYSLFEDNYEYDSNTEVRRSAFKAFSSKLRDYVHTTATAYQSHIQKEKTMATLRGFDSVIDSLLFPQEVTRDLYNRQIELIMKELAPHMRKYAKLLQKVHNLDKMTFADLKIAVDPDFDPKVTIEESKEYIFKGLSILGDDYSDMVKEAYDKRWVDFAKNKGKTTGGFCASPYKKGSYILLTWNDRMSDVFTLAHELGHAGHFRACGNSQSILDTEVSTYFVEAPSTMNELLMANYLKETNPDKRFKRWVLSSMISNTYYHNFVTHFIEAAYQRKVYEIIDNGGSVNAEVLSSIMKDTLEEFWGDAVEIDDDAALTWMRQPHYYMGLYSYTYSAGLTVATEVSKRIENEGECAIKDWKKVLAAGGTKTPEELAKMAGVDISTDEPLLNTIATIGEMIDEICVLTKELSL